MASLRSRNIEQITRGRPSGARRRTLALIPLALVLAGCAGDGGTDPDEPKGDIAAVVINPRGLTLPVGGRSQLSAVARNGAGAQIGASITWISRDQTIASASSDGEVSGNRAGQTQVIATAQGKSDTVNVAVIDNFRLVVMPPFATVDVGSTTQFTVMAFDGAGNPVPVPPVSWASSALNRATISGTGLARGVSGGTTNITASAGQRTSDPALLTVRDTSSSGPCDGIASILQFTGTVDYGFKAVGIENEGGFKIDADDNGHLEATMTRDLTSPFLAAWSGPISGNASVTQKKTGTGVTTLNGGGGIIALPPAGLPQMSFIVDLTKCTYSLRAGAVIRTRLVPEVGSPVEGPEIVALVQFTGPVAAWRSIGIFVPLDGVPAHAVAWGALNPELTMVMPIGLAASLFNPIDVPVGQGVAGLVLGRVP